MTILTVLSCLPGMNLTTALSCCLLSSCLIVVLAAYDPCLAFGQPDGGVLCAFLLCSAVLSAFGHNKGAVLPIPSFYYNDLSLYCTEPPLFCLMGPFSVFMLLRDIVHRYVPWNFSSLRSSPFKKYV